MMTAVGPMRNPARFNFSIVRGTTEPFTFRFYSSTTNEPLIFNDVELIISRGEASGPDILRLSLLEEELSLVTINSIAWIRWTPTEAQSRLIPVGRLSYYEVQLTTGAASRVYLCGRITGIGGLNDDS